jgi:dTDP-4-dehydrorhamnose 3,5-epimerase-like enzyme
MFFCETEIKDAVLIRPDRKSDACGYFARKVCQTEFQQHGLKTVFVQENVAYSRFALWHAFPAGAAHGSKAGAVRARRGV